MSEEYESYNGQILKKAILGVYPMQLGLALIAGMNTAIGGTIISIYIGDDALAAMGLVVPLTIALWMLINLIMGGVKVLAGQALGKNEKEEACRLFSLNLSVFLIFGIVSALIFYFFCDNIALLLKAEGQLKILTSEYIKGMAFMGFGMGIMNLLNSFCIFEGKIKLSLAATIVMTVVNFAVNIIFAEFFHLGMFESALSATLGYYAAAALLSTHFLKKSIFKLQPSLTVPVRTILEIVKIGMSESIIYLCLFFRPLIMNFLLLEYVGAKGLSAIGIAGLTVSIFGIFSTASGGVVLAIGSTLYGERDEISMREFIKNVFKICFFTALLVNIAVFTAAPFIVSLYTADKEISYMTIRAVRAFAIAQLFNVMLLITTQCYQSMALRKVFFINLLAYLIVPASISYIAIPVIGADGAWLALGAEEFITLIIVYIWLSIESRSFRFSLSKWIFWNSHFDISPEHRYDITLTGIEDIISISDKIIKTLNERCRDARTSHCGLAIEEICLNIAKYRFDKKLKGHPQIDLRIVTDDHGVKYIRIRDNCPPFNPLEQLSISENQDGFHNIGIRIVQKISKSITYNSLFNINILTIEF